MDAASQNKIALTLYEKIKCFDGKHPKSWFAHLEASFHLNGIFDSKTMYHFTVSCIPLPILDDVLKYATESYGITSFSENYFHLKRAIVDFFSK